MAHRICSFLWSSLVVVILFAAPIYARQVEGAQAWGQDGWSYQYLRGHWVRTALFRSFPVPKNANIYDLFHNGQFLKRVDVGEPGWTKEIPAAHFATTSALSWVAYRTNVPVNESNLFFVVKATNQWTTLPLIKAAAAASKGAQGPRVTGNTAGTLGGSPAYIPGVSPGSILGGAPAYIPGNTPGSYIGGTVPTPNVGLLTVDSVAAERARANLSPELQRQLQEIDVYLSNSNDAIIKVDRLGTYERTPRR
jgi:hypothetical protein